MFVLSGPTRCDYDDWSVTTTVLWYTFNDSLFQTYEDRVRGASGSILYLGSDSNYYPDGFDSDDPKPAKGRGLYFDGDDKAFVSRAGSATFPGPGTVIYPTFCFEAWAKVEDRDETFTWFQKYDAANKSVIQFNYYPTLDQGETIIKMNGAFVFSYTYAQTTAVDYSAWHLFTYSVSFSSMMFTHTSCMWIDKNQQADPWPMDYSMTYFHDESDFQFNVGFAVDIDNVSSTEKFFKGYLYEVKWFDKSRKKFTIGADSIDLSTCSGSCSACPGETSTCLETEDSFNKYLDGTWKNCLGTCTTYGTCVRGGDCNLCHDRLCKTCTSYSATGCTACMDNAHDDSGTCVCDTDYAWEESSLSCVKNCNAPCDNCITPDYCLTCQSGTFLWSDAPGICVAYCPEAYSEDSTNHECDYLGPSKVLHFSFEGISLEHTDIVHGTKQARMGSDTKYYPDPLYGGDDPLAMKHRGVYLYGGQKIFIHSGTDYIGTPTILNAIITFECWVNINGAGVIWGKYLADGTPQIELYYDSSAQRIKLYIKGTTGDGTAELNHFIDNEWTFVAFRMVYDESLAGGPGYKTYPSKDHHAPTQQDFVTGVMLDQATNRFTMGFGYTGPAASAGKFFTGFIFDARWYNQEKTHAAIQAMTTNSCTTYFDDSCFLCHSATASTTYGKTCLSLCLYNEYLDSSNSCQPCVSCSQGCVREEDCNLCNERLCKKCSVFGAQICDECVENASLVSNVCKCNASHYWDEPQDKCLPCQSPCEECATTDEYCTTCLATKYLVGVIPGVCFDECPTGLTANGPGRSCDGSVSGKILHFVFSDILLYHIDIVSGSIKGRMGANATYHPNLDANDPYPVKDRGIYFDGGQEMHLPPATGYTDTATLLSPKLTFESWCKMETSGGDRVLFGKYSSTGAMSLEFSLNYSSNQFKVQIQTAQALETQTFGHTFDTSWHLFALVIDYATEGHSFNTHVDQTSSAAATMTSRYWQDKATNKFVVGFGYNSGLGKARYLKAFIWEFRFYQEARSENDIKGNTATTCANTTGPCSICPSAGASTKYPAKCIDDCPLDEFNSAGTCSGCDGSCTKGCVRTEDCNLCDDRICENCTKFDREICSGGCLPHATLNATNWCKCDVQWYFDEPTDQCLACVSPCHSCITTNDYCVECASGKYMLPDTPGSCAADCPTGLTANTGTNTCDGTLANEVLHFVFDEITVYYLDKISTTKRARMGGDETYYPDYDANDP